MTFGPAQGEGAQALDLNQLSDALGGDAVVSGCAPSAGSADREVDVASGTARVGGSDVSVTAQTVTLSVGDSEPRKDVIYIDSSGNAQTSEGTAEAAEPSGNTRFNTYKPAPADSTGITGAIVAEVWVPANHSSTFQSADISDRRILLSNLDPKYNSVLAQLRLGNAQAAQARDNADSSWVNLLQLNASDRLELLTRLAQIRLANDTYLEGRNQADGAWQNLIKIDTNDKLAHGVNWAGITTDTLNTHIHQRDSETVQSAINRASSGDIVHLRAGTFSENIDVTTSNVTVVGAGRGTVIDGTTADALKASATGVTLKRIAAKTTAGGGNTARAIVLRGNDQKLSDFWVLESDDNGVHTGGDDSGLIILNGNIDSANVDGSDVSLNSDNSVVDDIIGSVTDNGAGNSVGETA